MPLIDGRSDEDKPVLRVQVFNPLATPPPDSNNLAYIPDSPSGIQASNNSFRISRQVINNPDHLYNNNNTSNNSPQQSLSSNYSQPTLIQNTSSGQYLVSLSSSSKIYSHSFNPLQRVSLPFFSSPFKAALR